MGHLLAAAPVVDAIVGIQILENGVIPPTIDSPGFSGDGETASFHGIARKPITQNVRRLLINCQSVEGQCASLILEKE